MRYAGFLALLVASIGAFAAQPSYSPPTEFRGHQWGKKFTDFPEMTSVTKDGATALYSLNGDELAIGDATLNALLYGFYDDQFFTVFIPFSGNSNARAILQALEAKYGKGSQQNRYIPRYMWGTTTTVTILYNYSDVSKEGSVTYAYRPIAEKRASAARSTAERARDQL